MSNSGDATAALHARSGNQDDAPRCYTVEPGKQLEGLWHAAWAGQSRYDLEVHGPNGFPRAYRGAAAGASRANMLVRARYDKSGGHQDAEAALLLTLVNRSAQRASVRITDQCSGRAQTIELRVGESERLKWDVERSGRWYDLVITVAGDADFRVRLAGRIENGRDGISDPAFGQ